MLSEDNMMEDDFSAQIRTFDEKVCIFLGILWSNYVHQVTSYLEEIVAAKFPLDSQALDPSTDMGTY